MYEKLEFMTQSGKKFKVLITGGGTGGHIFPAIAVAQKLKEDADIEKIFYVGCKKNMEKDAAAKADIDFYSINVSGLPRKISLKSALLLIEAGFATLKSIYLLLKLKPDVVFGTGGYVSGPVLAAAYLLKVPFVIHDPDAHPGIVNRLMASKAFAVSTAFESAADYLKSENITLNGNPVRAELLETEKSTALKELNFDGEKKILFVTGGSQGAKTVNDAVLGALPDLINKGIQVIHQTGAKNYDEYMKEFEKKYPKIFNGETVFNPDAYIVRPFFDNMAVPLNAADLAVARAGSLSISELNLCGLPSVLVPYPYAAADHQRFNARAMVEIGASIFLEDSECTSEKLTEIIFELFNDSERLERMKSACKSAAKPRATESIVKIIKEAAGK